MIVDICTRYIDISNITGIHKYKKETWIRNPWRA